MSEAARRTALQSPTPDPTLLPAERGEVVWVDDLDGFLALEHEWDELLAASTAPDLTHAWLRCWWEAFGSGQPRVCTVRRDGRLVGALPLWSRRGALTGWSNDETDSLKPVAATDADLETLVDAVMSAPWGRLRLQGLPESDRGTHLLLDRARADCLFLFQPLEDSPFIETTGTLEDYRRSMSRNTRQRVGKHRRRLEREHDVSIFVLTAPPNPLERLDEALALEAAGWKGRAGSAVLSSDARTAFFRGLARDGSFRVSELHVDGRLAAFDVALVRGGRVFSLITSYDEGLGSYSPGLVLRMAIVEACFEQGLAANDLLGMALDWKVKFATGTRPTRMLRCYRRRPLPMARYAVRATILPTARRAYNRLNELRRRRARQGGDA